MATKVKENTIEDLRAMGTEQLKEKLASARHQLMDLRLKELKNPHEIRWVRRDIARVLTIINEKGKGEKVEGRK